MTKKQKDHGYHQPNPYLLLKEPPPSLVALRTELQLPQNIDIFQAAEKGNTFEECIGIIASKLDIVLDGDYEPAPLFEMLIEAMRGRHKNASQPWKRAVGLVPVEIQEKEGEVELVEIKEEDTVIVPSTTAANEKDEKDVAIH